MSIKIPKVAFEDVLIKVDSFYFLVDYVILDNEPIPNVRCKIPMILGCPFLATSNALINFRNGMMQVFFGNLKAEFLH